MPHGTRHEFTGLLVAEASGLKLRLPDGRTWRLVGPAGIERHIGRQVRVSAMRGEEGWLHVERMDRV